MAQIKVPDEIRKWLIPDYENDGLQVDVEAPEDVKKKAKQILKKIDSAMDIEV